MKKHRFLVWLGIVVMAMGVGALALSVSERGSQEPSRTTEFKWKPGSDFEDKARGHIESANMILELVLEKIKNDASHVTVEWITKIFQNTYLKNPKLYVDGGKPIEGWDKVLPELKKMIEKYGSISRGNTNVDLTYQSYDAVKSPTPANDVDFVLTIRTDLAFAPDMDPPIEGELFHRRICEIDP